MDKQVVVGYRDWCWEKKCHAAVSALERTGFKAKFMPDSEAAREYILEHLGDAKSVGFGGSMSVAVLNLTKELAARGCEILNHGFPDLSPEQRLEIMRKQLTCDLFLTGTNALSMDGALVNIDGIGNRVNALTFGPKKAIVLVGRNKIVEGDVAAAVAKVHEFAAPANAHRLGYKTPCGESGICVNCSVPERICRAVSVLERKPFMSDIHVLVVNEVLGL